MKMNKVAFAMLMTCMSSLMTANEFESNIFKGFDTNFSRNSGLVSNSFAQNKFNDDFNVANDRINSQVKTLLSVVIISYVAIYAAVAIPTSLAAWNACGKRQKLEAKVKAFKATLNKEQLVIFNQTYKPFDTWATTKAPFGIQVVSLVMMSVTVQFVAAGAAAGAQYLEYYNEKQFNNAVEVVTGSTVPFTLDETPEVK